MNIGFLCYLRKVMLWLKVVPLPNDMKFSTSCCWLVCLIWVEKRFNTVLGLVDIRIPRWVTVTDVTAQTLRIQIKERVTRVHHPNPYQRVPDRGQSFLFFSSYYETLFGNTLWTFLFKNVFQSIYNCSSFQNFL